MKSGVILEIKDRHAIVMKNDGEILIIKAKKDWKKGELIFFKNIKKGIYSFGLLAASFIIVLFYWNYQKRIPQNPSFLISIDVNPSIELEVNRFDKVISMTAKNEQGENLAAELNIINKPYQEAVAIILTNSTLYQYIVKNGDITFTVSGRNPEKEEEIISALKKTANDHLPSLQDLIEIECYSVKKEFVEDAHQHGVTAGKYLYLLELQRVASDIDMDEYTHHSISDIKDQIRECEIKHGYSENTSQKGESDIQSNDCHNQKHHGCN